MIESTKSSSPKRFNLTYLVIIAALVIVFCALVAFRITDAVTFRSETRQQDFSDVIVDIAPVTDGGLNMREYLDSIGGEKVQLNLYVVNQSEKICKIKVGADHTVGCHLNSMPNHIYFTDNIVKFENDPVRSLLAHELAHVYQYRISDSGLTNNAEVRKAFLMDKPEEGLADCMSAVKTGNPPPSYLSSCDDRQLELAEMVWDGIIP